MKSPTISKCFYKDQLCHNCGKKGHIARMCKGNKTDEKTLRTTVKGKSGKWKGQTKKRSIHQVDANMEKSEEETNSDTDTELTLHKVTATRHNSPWVNKMKSETDLVSAVIKVQPKIEGLPIEM